MGEVQPRRVRGGSVALAIAGLAFAGGLVLARNAVPVPSNIFDVAAALVAAFGISALAEDFFGPPAATTVRGAGLLVGIILFFGMIGGGLEQMMFPLVTGLAGATLLQADARAKRSSAARVTIGSGLVLTGLGLAWASSNALPEPARFRAALTIGGVAAALGMALRITWRNTRHSTSAPNPVGLLAGAALVGVYIAYRPSAAARVSNLAIYEWAIAVSAAILLFARLRRVAQASQTPEAWASDATRHAQDVRPIYDARMTALAGAIQRYLDTGDGFEDYHRALEGSLGGPLPVALGEALRAASGHSLGIGRKARESAANKRLAAHEAALSQLIPPRGPTHGRSERTLHPNP